MAVIKVLKDEQLRGTADPTDVYPVTHFKAVYNDTGETLENVINKLNTGSDKSFRYTFELKITKGSSINLNNTSDDSRIIAWTTVLKREYFSGDVEEVGISDYSILYTIKTKSTNETKTLPSPSYMVPKKQDTYTITATAVIGTKTFTEKKDVVATTESIWGFSKNDVTSIVSLSNSAYRNTIGGTITVNADPTQGTFACIYFLFPSNIQLSSISQPDSLNAPLGFEKIGATNWSISGVSYPYNIYKSKDDIETKKSIKLTLK